MENFAFSKEKFALTERGETGPWIENPTITTNDYSLNFARYHNRNIYIQLPDDLHRRVTQNFFTYIPDASVYYFGAEYKFDLFSTVDDLTELLNKKDKKRVIATLKKKRVISGEKVLVEDAFALPKSLGRLRKTALAGDTGSLEAITLLHNLAIAGKKIAVINAHGDVCLEESELMLLINATNNHQVEANEIITDLENSRESSGNLRYSAIYIMSCNSYKDTEKFAEVRNHNIPVVIHTTKHDTEKDLNPGKVFWP